MIDPSPWFEWRPGLHELVSGVSAARGPAALETAAGVARRTSIPARHGDRHRPQARACSRRPTTGGSAFDACIVAVGGVTHTFGVEGADTYALPLKTVDDGVAIGRRLATLARGKGRRSIVIIGAGLEGIEVLGEILRSYRRRESLHISVIEAGQRLMPGSPRESSSRRCARIAPVSTWNSWSGAAVKSVTAQSRAPAFRGIDALGPHDLDRGRNGAGADPRSRARGRPQRWAPCARRCEPPFDNVFVAGDAAAPPGPSQSRRTTRCRWGSSRRRMPCAPWPGAGCDEFAPSPKPMLVAFGDLDTFLVSGRSVIASATLAAAKELVFQLTMAQFDPPLAAPLLR